METKVTYTMPVDGVRPIVYRHVYANRNASATAAYGAVVEFGCERAVVDAFGLVIVIDYTLLDVNTQKTYTFTRPAPHAATMAVTIGCNDTEEVDSDSDDDGDDDGDDDDDDESGDYNCSKYDGSDFEA